MITKRDRREFLKVFGLSTAAVALHEAGYPEPAEGEDEIEIVSTARFSLNLIGDLLRIVGVEEQAIRSERRFAIQQEDQRCIIVTEAHSRAYAEPSDGTACRPRVAKQKGAKG